MLKGVLFDLDETLLDLDIKQFMTDYVTDLCETFYQLGNANQDKVKTTLKQAITFMMSPRNDGLTNEEAFDKVVSSGLGVSVFDDSSQELFEQYYTTKLPKLQKGYKAHAGARESVKLAQELGLKVVLATNPGFPLPVTQERVRWTGLSPDDFEIITSYETSHYSKPDARYYLETLNFVDLKPEESIMIGNDIVKDLPTPDIGLDVYYTEDDKSDRVKWYGSLTELPELLKKLAS